MSKRYHNVRTTQALVDLEIVIDGLAYSIDVFYKFLDASLLEPRPVGLTTYHFARFQPGGNVGLVDDVPDITLDPRLNQASKTFFARYTGDLPDLEHVSYFQFSLSYVSDMTVANPVLDVIEFTGTIAP